MAYIYIYVMEEWKYIDGFNYSISSYGRVKNNRSGKYLSNRLCGGYNRVALHRDGKQRTIWFIDLLLLLL